MRLLRLSIGLLLMGVFVVAVLTDSDVAMVAWYLILALVLPLGISPLNRENDSTPKHSSRPSATRH